MPFVKIDTGILESTLWIDRAARDIFITALLMAEPREITEPTPTYFVDRIEETGFIVPPGWYGFVPAASVGIARRALVEPEEGIKALETLGGADPHSRSPEYEGRRLVRIDGGFIVLNYFKYRDRDYTAAERMAKLRARRKAQTVTPNMYDVTRNSDVADAYADSDANAEANKNYDEVAKLPLPNKKEYPVYRQMHEVWVQAYPGVDVMAEYPKMAAWLVSNPTQGKTARGMGRFINNWLSREQDKPKGGQRNGKSTLIDAIRDSRRMPNFG